MSPQYAIGIHIYLHCFSILKRYICLCFRANIDLYQMRLAVFVCSSGLGDSRAPDTRLDTLQNTQKYRNSDKKYENTDIKFDNTQIQTLKNV